MLAFTSRLNWDLSLERALATGYRFRSKPGAFSAFRVPPVGRPPLRHGLSLYRLGPAPPLRPGHAASAALPPSSGPFYRPDIALLLRLLLPGPLIRLARYLPVELCTLRIVRVSGVPYILLLLPAKGKQQATREPVGALPSSCASHRFSGTRATCLCPYASIAIAFKTTCGRGAPP